MLAEQEPDTHAEADQLDTIPTELPPVPVPDGAHDYEAQRLWEERQVFEGKWRYARSRLKQTGKGGEDGYRETRLDENEPGQVIAAKLISPMVEAVRDAREKVRETYAATGPGTGASTVSDAAWVLMALPVETLAVVTVLSALSHAEPCTVLSACKDVGAKVKQEWGLVLWKQREKAAQLEREAVGADWEPNLTDLMYKRNDSVDERVFNKWSKKADRFVKEEWDQEKRVLVGASLLSLLLATSGVRHNVEAGVYQKKRKHLLVHKRDVRLEADREIPDGTWFEVFDKEEGFKTTQIFQLTEWGRQWVANRHHQNALARPYMLPMICEPLDYEYIEPTQPDVEAEEAEAFSFASE